MKWSERSRAHLLTCRPELIELFERVRERCTERGLDCSITCGYRNAEDQQKAVEEGRSFVSFPNSAHNKSPSIAVDCIPYPVNWKQPLDFYRLAAIVLQEAHEMGIRVKWGGMFKRKHGQPWFDGPHYELMEP